MTTTRSYFVPIEGGDDDERRRWQVTTLEDGSYQVETPAGEELVVDAYAPEPGRLHLVQRTGRAADVGVREREGELVVEVGDERHLVEVLNERQRRMRVAGVGGRGVSGPELTSPMAGKVVAVQVEPGDTVDEGERVLIVEAMKMENDLSAHIAGTIEDVHVEVGQAVEIGDVLVTIAAQ